MYDLIIKNALVIDGTGTPAFRSDIAILDGKIAKVARGLTDAKNVLDAQGKAVTPGFIDSHSHSDGAVLTYPELKEKIEQGITTSIAGQCGFSPAPLSRDFDPKTAKQVGTYGKETEVYDTIPHFLACAEKTPLGSNTAFLIGYGAVRKAVMGMDKRDPTPEEMKQMCQIIRDGMEAGALGMSFGIFYTPGYYAKTEEMIEAGKVVAEFHGVLAAHIRDEDDYVVQATEEFLTILREAGTRGVFSHHKSKSKENWGKCTHTLRMIDEANDSGMDVFLDVYPYIASHTNLPSVILPDPGQRVQERLADPKEREKMKEYGRSIWGEDLSWILLVSSDSHPEYIGMRIPEIAKARGTDVYDAAYDMIQGSSYCSACYFSMCEEDVETIIAHPRAMIGTDSSVACGKTVFHPRLKATFPRVLSHYVRERKVTSLAEMIRKMTAMPAAVYGLATKGLIREGMDADLCIFDPDTIQDQARFDAPNLPCKGLAYVLLGGEVVVEDAVFNGKKMGKAIFRK